MKKFFTLMILSAFVAVSAFAEDSSLGDVKWSIKDGAKINPAKTITLTFPNATGFEFGSTVEIACNLYAADEAPSDDNAFDGIEGTITDGVAFILPDFEVVESTKYILKVTSILVNGAEVIGDTVYTLNFATRGGERKLSWDFTGAITTAEKDSIQKHIDSEAKKEDETERDPYWAVSGTGAKARFQYKKALNEDELCLPDGTPIAMTEGLYITTKADQLLVPQSTASSSVLRLHLAKANTVLIPDCKAGDKVTIKASYVDTKSAYYLQIPGATCESATNEAKDSLATPKSAASYQFTVLEDGDLTVKVGNSCLYSIDIVEKTDFKPKYSVVAVDPQGNVIKTYVEETEGEAGDLITGHYSHWLRTAQDSLVTYGSVGSEMSYTFTLASDTTFVIKYKSTGIGNVVYFTEAEDLFDSENLDSPVQLLSTGNEPVRASVGKAAYAISDYTMTTIPAGLYKIKAGLWDKTKGGGSIQTFTIGENTIELASTSDNLSVVESTPFEVTEETSVVWKSNGSNQNGIDMIVIYATDELPEPDLEIGDANGDGEITMADANMVVNYFLAEDKDSIENFNFDAADANQDGEITMADANKIVNIFLGTDSVVE